MKGPTTTTATDRQTNTNESFNSRKKKAHLRRTGELDAIPSDELDTITILLVKVHGDLSVYGGFAVLVAGEPDVL
jgi:hypothetical protein